ncbi:hypothetical protein NDU88_001964 [Pleurodeles waltl]|uniref:Uncharacterized protein n=1 Tax=Pleurodeles waltl TaxID=8319 RepID=A0AAV7RBW6_PLEWA|nr:hypothetical protein NDU88_001964 [Pleurodeles waltl]
MHAIQGLRSALEQQIETVSIDLNLLIADFHKVSEKVNTAETNIGSLQGEMASLEKQMTTVSAEVTELGRWRRMRRDPDRLVEYLTEVRLPQLNETGVQALEADLTLEEVTVAIKSLPLGRSPGSDGFTAELYQTFVTVLAP